MCKLRKILALNKDIGILLKRSAKIYADKQNLFTDAAN